MKVFLGSLSEFGQNVILRGSMRIVGASLETSFYSCGGTTRVFSNSIRRDRGGIEKEQLQGSKGMGEVKWMRYFNEFLEGGN